jgi:hypothetical protein
MNPIQEPNCKAIQSNSLQFTPLSAACFVPTPCYEAYYIKFAWMNLKSVSLSDKT